jgi:glutaminase
MLMDDAHARFASVDDGRPSQTYPALARASPELFGICVVGARGGVYGVGDDEVEFTIMSVAKPFVLALICPLLGPEEVRRRIGVSRGALSGDPADAVDLYTRQSCLAVSARDLATMGATLALGGVNPVTGERVVDENTCRHVLARHDDGRAVPELG